MLDNDQVLADLINHSDHKVVALWAADCAERVLPYFDDAYPEDPRPNAAIEAARAWAHGTMKFTAVRKAALDAHAAARDAQSIPAACSAARAAGHAAATAHVPRHAMGTAIYAVSAVRDASPPADADAAMRGERGWQYQHLLAMAQSQST
ncbi:MAG: hypothetical protein JNJ61_08970 [Anaerolineae bacterium]|nr:hypothetical protein [Anaerolineae bacterium]